MIKRTAIFLTLGLHSLVNCSEEHTFLEKTLPVITFTGSMIMPLAGCAAFKMAAVGATSSISPLVMLISFVASSYSVGSSIGYVDGYNEIIAKSTFGKLQNSPTRTPPYKYALAGLGLGGALFFLCNKLKVS
jgi:hypothetical protein